MNAREMLLQEFHRLAEVPDAVPRLRRFVLNLAVRGKLVEQDPRDESAHVLLGEMAKRRAADGPKNRRRREVAAKPGESGEGKDALFVLPRNWAWCRVNDVGAVVGGGTPPSGDDENFTDGGSGTGWLTPADLGEPWSGRVRHGARDLTAKGLDCSSATIMPPGTVLFTSRAPIGYVAIAACEISTNQGFKSVVPFVGETSEYIALYFRAFGPWIDARAPGTTFREVSGKIVAALPFPLPPLAEQRRIVAKVDELMALCDRLEAAQKRREDRRESVAAASLAGLGTAGDLPERRETARFYLRSLAHVSARAEQVEQHRQTILDLAVRGQLTSAAAWPPSPAPLGEFARLQGGYAFESDWFVREGTRLLRNTNVGHGRLNWDETECLPEGRVAEFERFRLAAGDVVLSMDRPFIATGTKVARMRSDDLPCLLLQRVGRFLLRDDRLTLDFLFLWVRSPHFSKQVDPGRSNGVPHISSRQVEAAKIYVPSPAEQRRVVAQVDELMALCDQLEEQIRIGRTHGGRLLETVIQEALAEAS